MARTAKPKRTRAPREVTSAKHASAKRQVSPTAPQGERMPQLTKTNRKSMAPKVKANHQTWLEWHRAHDLEKLEIDVKTIFVHERIQPEYFIRSVRRRTAKEEVPLLAKIWDDFNGTEGGDCKFYQHANWSNSLIHGNSIEVMASLLDKEGDTMAGKVQCIYFDPPYGIDFRGFKQRLAGGKSGDATGRGGEAAGSLRAFVDSYARTEPDGDVVTGLPVYLDGMYRVARLAHQLLAESGSMFVQISAVNVNRVALIMDEVFGEANRMSMIKYQTGATETRTLGRSGDYVLWYAKDKASAEQVFNAIYEKRSQSEYMEEAGANAIGRHTDDGRIRTWAQLVAEYGDNVPREWEPGKKDNITSQHKGTALQGRSWPRCENCPGGDACNIKNCLAPEYQKNPSKYHDKLSCVFNVRPRIPSPDLVNQWRVNNPVGLDRLADQDRLCVSVRTNEGQDAGVCNVREFSGDIKTSETNSVTAIDGLLMQIRFYADDPGKKIVDHWGGGRVRAKSKLFPVQTPEKFIERCILMASHPGDLVFDPTCGSGTTAVVAERHGRRWITSDAGAWQIAIARERLATAVFDDYLLRGTPEGKRVDAELDEKHGTRLATTNPVDADDYDPRDPAQGFVYDRRQGITAGVLSRDERPPDIPLVDRPQVPRGGKRCRVCSAFTVERLAPYEIIDNTQIIEPATVSETSKRAEINLEGFEKFGVRLEGIRARTPLSGDSLLTHEGAIGGEKSAIWIAQPSEIVSEYQLNKAATEAAGAGFKHIVIAGFGYEDATRPQRPRSEGIKVWCAILPISLTISDTEAEMANPPVLLAEPSLSAAEAGDGRVSITVEGFVTWNPLRAAEVGGGDASEVACILIDTDYDGIRFNAKRIQFPEPPEELELDPYRKALENQVEHYRAALDELIDKDAWKYVRSTECIPFTPPRNGAVAVRIITADGDTMTRVIEARELAELTKFSSGRIV